MRKIYINPEMTIIQLSFTQQILSGSIDVNSTGDPIDASNAASRGTDFSDDFDE